MAPAPIDVSIVILNYNTRDHLRVCLNSLREEGSTTLSPGGEGSIGAEVFVVDNASSDGSTEMVRAEFPEVELRALDRNLGFSGGNNLVLAGARSPYLLLLNPDTEVQPGALATLLATLAANPRVAAVGPRLLYPDGRYQHSAFRLPGLVQAFFGFFSLVPLDSPWNGRYPLPRSPSPRPVEHLLGACLLLRREALEAVGLLDERFFIYFEETDWCARARRAGWQLWQVPAATVVHHSGGTTRLVAEEMSLEFHRSQAVYYRKHYGLLGYLLLKAIVLLGVSYRLARSLRATLRRNGALTVRITVTAVADGRRAVTKVRTLRLHP